MVNHLKFKVGEQKSFLKEVSNKSSFKNEQLAKIAAISSRNYRDWKIEKYLISKYAALKLSKKFNVPLPEKISTLEDRWKKYKSEKGKIGGYAYKSKYGSPGTLQGRKKGGRIAIKKLRDKGLIPAEKTFLKPRKSTKLAEFVGIMLGDGGITKEQIQISLNREADKDYIEYVINLCQSLFREKPKHFQRKDSLADCVYYNGQQLVRHLNSIGLVVGNKVKLQVSVPEWVRNNKKYAKMCCRGLMDTDGGIHIHRYRVNGKQYRYQKLAFTNNSVPLANFVYHTLLKNGLHPKMRIHLEKRQVWLYNSNEVVKYLDRIGSSNKRLLKFK